MQSRSTSNLDVCACRKAPRTIENSHGADVKLSAEETAEIWKLIDSFEIKGDRYYGMDPKAMHLWG